MVFLCTCPRKDITCLFLTDFGTSISTTNHRKAFSFVTLSVRAIRKTRLRNHSSAALILLSFSLSYVHLLHPPRRIEHNTLLQFCSWFGRRCPYFCVTSLAAHENPLGVCLLPSFSCLFGLLLFEI